MCFSRPKVNTTTPAAAPAPPDPVAEPTELLSRRRQEDVANYGVSSPSLRVDRSSTEGGVGAGGYGLKM